MTAKELFSLELLPSIYSNLNAPTSPPGLPATAKLHSLSGDGMGVVKSDLLSWTPKEPQWLGTFIWSLFSHLESDAHVLTKVSLLYIYAELAKPSSIA